MHSTWNVYSKIAIQLSIEVKNFASIFLWFITMCRVFVTYKFFFRWNCQIDRFRLWKHIKISTIPILVICISYDSCTMSIIWIELWHLECGIPDLYNELTYNWCAIFCYFAMFSFYGFCRLSYFFSKQQQQKIISNAYTQLVSFEKC